MFKKTKRGIEWMIIVDILTNRQAHIEMTSYLQSRTTPKEEISDYSSISKREYNAKSVSFSDLIFPIYLDYLYPFPGNQPLSYFGYCGHGRVENHRRNSIQLLRCTRPWHEWTEHRRGYGS